MTRSVSSANSELTLDLLDSEGFYRIDGGGASCGQIAGEGGSCGEDERDGEIGEGIERADAEEERLHGLRESPPQRQCRLRLRSR